MSIERWIKRYVWDDERTPYLVPPAKLTRRQADHEIFACCVLLGFLFAVVALASAGRAAVALYAISMVVMAITLACTKHVYAAWYCATAPLAAALYLALGGLPDHLGTIDHVVIVALILLWARYALRVVAIAKLYERLPG